MYSPNVYVTTDCNVSIEESNLSELSFYPNPTNSLLTIETEFPDHYSIEITSLNGQQIFIGEMVGTTHQLDLSSFQKGVYFITIWSED
ncbi:MAG: T9SS type A sorting domain-containing protein, partial [Anaerolineaceae bacterium]|nr:T9SS type A sorting domain-containing protein [Anaerolineaceae bacterium]